MRKYKFDEALVARYYEEKFAHDMSNYFVVGKSEHDYSRMDNYEVTYNTILPNLFDRNPGAFDGEPGVYMGCGPWWSAEHNYLFSGMFAYMYIAQKVVHCFIGFAASFEFCKNFRFPILTDMQSEKAFDIIAALKEAAIAPAKVESENYIAMLDVVMPYMRSLTKDFLDRYSEKYCIDLSEIINSYISYLYDWVEKTQDEMISFYGEKFRKEYLPEGAADKIRYFMIKPFSEARYGRMVYTLGEIAELGQAKGQSTDITRFDGPMVLHYKDVNTLYKLSKKVNESVLDFSEDGSVYDSKSENDLHNTLANTLYNDFRYEEDGKVGIKDCWGRIVAPAKYKNCIVVGNELNIGHEKGCVAVKHHGKWALVRRLGEREFVTQFEFDNIELVFPAYFLVYKGDKCGLYTHIGRELIPPVMDDICEISSIEGHILYKKNGGYGFYLMNDKSTEDVFEKIELKNGELVSVCRNGEWGYIDENARFTTDKESAYLYDYGFSFNSIK